MEKLKCKHCGNEEYFYIKEKYSGETEVIVDNKGDFEDTGLNSEAYDYNNSTLKSVFYYCCKCDSKVAKIPEDKRY